MVLVVVQPENHGRISGYLQQQVSVVSQPLFSEQLYLGCQVVIVIHLGVAGGKYVMPEQGHLLLERALGVDHVVEPVGRAGRRAWAAGLGGGDVPVQQVLVCARRVVGGRNKLLDDTFVPFLGQPLKLVACGSKSGATHKMGCQGYIPCVIWHWMPPFLKEHGNRRANSTTSAGSRIHTLNKGRGTVNATRSVGSVFRLSSLITDLGQPQVKGNHKGLPLRESKSDWYVSVAQH